MLIDKSKDTSEYWRETEILSLVKDNELDIDYDRCEQSLPISSIVKFPSRRTVRPICKSRIGKFLLTNIMSVLIILMVVFNHSSGLLQRLLPRF